MSGEQDIAGIPTSEQEDVGFLLHGEALCQAYSRFVADRIKVNQKIRIPCSQHGDCRSWPRSWKGARSVVVQTGVGVGCLR